MNLHDKLATLYGIPTGPVDVETRLADGTTIVLRWFPEERWFFYGYANETCFVSLHRIAVRSLADALRAGDATVLWGWKLRAYTALVKAGIRDVDPDFSRRDAFGNKST